MILKKADYDGRRKKKIPTAAVYFLRRVVRIKGEEVEHYNRINNRETSGVVAKIYPTYKISERRALLNFNSSRAPPFSSTSFFVAFRAKGLKKMEPSQKFSCYVHDDGNDDDVDARAKSSITKSNTLDTCTG